MCACTHVKPYAPYATYIHAPPTPQKNQELLRKPADKKTLNILIAEVQTCVAAFCSGKTPLLHADWEGAGSSQTVDH